MGERWPLPLADHDAHDFARVGGEDGGTTLSRHDLLIEEQKFAAGSFGFAVGKLIVNDLAVGALLDRLDRGVGVMQIGRAQRDGHHILAGSEPVGG